MTTIKTFLTADTKLPSPPAIAMRILELVRSDSASFEEFSKIISADPALTAKILKLANSPLFALPRKVESVDRALSVLGLQTLKNLTLSYVFSADFRGKSEHFDFDLYWKRAIVRAVSAELLNVLLGRRGQDLFVTALLQEIGIMVIHLLRPEEFRRIMNEKMASGAPINIIEQRVFGFDHQELGADLLQHWELPGQIIGPIRHHHEPQEAPEEFRLAANILFLADKVSAIYFGSHSAESVQELKEYLLKHFQVRPDKADELIDRAAEQSKDMIASFEIDPGDMKPFSQLIQEANEELGKLNLSYEHLIMEYKQAKERAEKLAQELSAANQKLQEIASRDGLTGLYNHRIFQEILTKEISKAERYGRQLSLILFDIDHFKKVNDTYGHPAGDVVLKEVSAKASQCVREADIVARYGGEEFAVILPETPPENAIILANRIRLAIQSMTALADKTAIKVTISLGVTGFLPGKTSSDKGKLINAADTALYSSKHGGRNRATLLEAPAA